MKTFFVSDVDSATRARESQLRQTPDTFSGVDLISGEPGEYVGIVHSVDDQGEAAPADKRWRVTINPGIRTVPPVN